MISLYRYHLPFKKPFATSLGSFSHREGLLIQYKDDQLESVVEAAPLPGFSVETTTEIERLLTGNAERLNTFYNSAFTKSDLNAFLDSLPQLPSIQFALSWLGIDLLIQRNRETYQSLFQKTPATSIRVNATVGISDEETTIAAIDNFSEQGFDTIKLKASQSINKLVSILDTSTSRHPKLYFRIDANQSWQSENLTSILNQLLPFPIEYIEEPIAFKTIDEVAELSKASPIPIALDESLNRTISLEAALERLTQTVLIIKPMMMGNFLKLYETITRFRSLVDSIVVTTSLESAVGRRMVIKAASIIGDKAKAHGLHTGPLFTSDLREEQLISGSSITVGKMRGFTMSELKSDLLVPIGSYGNE